MTVTAADIEFCLDRLASIASRATAEQRRRMVGMKRRLERELAAFQSADDEMAELIARRQPRIAGSNGNAAFASSAARHSSVPPAP